MIAWIRTALRRLRDERLSAVGLAALVFATALAAAAAPRLEARVGDDTLQETLARAQPAARNIQWLREDRFIAPDPIVAVDEISNQVHDLLPDRIAALVTERSWSVDTGRWQLPEVAGDPATMRLRIQPDALSRVTLREGRWPTGATVLGEDRLSDELIPPKVRFFEVALAVPSATLLGVKVGDTLALRSDNSDPLVGRGRAMDMGVTIVGLYEANDQADPWWLGGLELAQPSIRSLGGDARVSDTFGLVSPDAYLALLQETEPSFLNFRYTFREYVDPSRLHAAAVPALLVDLKRLEAAYTSTNVTFNQPTALRTALRATLETFNAQWASASALLTVGIVGPAVVAAAALGLVAVLAAQRRRSALALARGRGASMTQVVVAVVAEGSLIAAPMAAAAVAVAVVLIRAQPILPSVLGGAIVATLAVVLLVLATVPATGGSSFGPVREVAVPRPPTPRRLILEGLVVVLALGGAALLRDRGVQGSSVVGQIAQADPLIAAVPALVGIAAGLIVVRLFPYPLRLLAWIARRRRDLVPLLALRRSAQAASSAAILVVLLATATIASFSVSVLAHMDRVADVSAWRTVGADYRVDNGVGALRTGFDPDAIPGVEASAVAYHAVITVGPRNLRTDFIALAADDYERVVADTAADPHLPVDLVGGTPTVIPLVASPGVSSRADGIKIGDSFRLTLEGYTFPTQVVGVRGDLLAFSHADLYVIASRDQIRALFPNIPLLPSTVFLRAPHAPAAAITAAVAAQVPVGASVTSRLDVTNDLRHSPASGAVAAGITVATILAMAYAALAVAAAMALSGASRAVEVAHLRTVGLSGRQASSLIVFEHGPAVAVAFLGGLGLGIGLLAALRDGLGIEALVGRAPDVPIGLDPAQLLLLLGGIVVVVVLGLGLGSWMQRGAAPIAALRRGFE